MMNTSKINTDRSARARLGDDPGGGADGPAESGGRIVRTGLSNPGGRSISANRDRDLSTGADAVTDRINKVLVDDLFRADRQGDCAMEHHYWIRRNSMVLSRSMSTMIQSII